MSELLIHMPLTLLIFRVRICNVRTKKCLNCFAFRNLILVKDFNRKNILLVNIVGDTIDTQGVIGETLPALMDLNYSNSKLCFPTELGLGRVNSHLSG